MPPKAKPKGEAPKDGPKKKGRPDSAATAPAAGAGASEDLTNKLVDAQKQLQHEQEERNFVQLERDRILSFWEVTKGNLEDALAEGQQKERDAEHQGEVHQVELKAFKQKIKHLLYEHGLHIEALKADREAALKSSTDDFRTREAELSADKRTLRAQLREQETFFENAAQAARIEAAKRESKLRAQLAGEAKGLADKHEAQLAAVRDAAEVQRKAEQHAIEERKNAHIQALMAQHEKAFAEMKAYFNGVVRDNLDAIMALKAELGEHKRRETSTQALLQDVVAENKRLSEPLDRAQAEVEELKKTATTAARDKASLSMARTRLAQATTDLDRLRFENEVWQQRLECEETERRALQQRFDSTVASLQQSAAATTLLLSKHAESTSRLDLDPSDLENQNSGENGQTTAKLGGAAVKGRLSQSVADTSRGLKVLNKSERQSLSPGRKIRAHHGLEAQRSRSEKLDSSYDDLHLEGVGPPLAGLVHS